MQESGPSKQSQSIHASQAVKDDAVPGFIVSSLIAGLPFLGLMMTLSIVSGHEHVGRLVTLLAMLIVEGLAMAFFWRRVDPTGSKNFAAATYAVGLWAFMAGCLVTTFGMRFGGMEELARNVALLGSGVVAVSGFFFAIVWAQSQAPRLMVQTHTMIATSVVLAGFTALVLKGSASGGDSHGETLSAHPLPSHEPSHHSAPTDHEPDSGHGELQPQDSAPAKSHHGSPSADGPDEHSQTTPHARDESPHHSKAKEDHHVRESHRDAVHSGEARGVDSHAGHHAADSTSDRDHAQGRTTPRDASKDLAPDADKKFFAALQGWSYEGSTGPETWGKLKSDWKQCSSGREQSPIDIPKGAKTSRRVISLSYDDASLLVGSNGEFLRAIVEKGHQAIINGKAFALRRIDFHSPSEHTLGGVSYPLEIQFVHTSPQGQTAIISTFVEKGQAHKEMGKITDLLPLSPYALRSVPGAVQLNNLLPRELTALSHEYRGSLTIPPCTEGVLWAVLKSPLKMSADQITAFRSQYAGSNRPLQSLGKRRVGPVAEAAAH